MREEEKGLTTNQVMEQATRRKPNTVSDRDAADWVMDLNTRLIWELRMPEDLPCPKDWPEDGDMPLAASGPYEDLYPFYLIAMIEYTCREHANYNNSIVLFNDRVADFRRWYRRTHRPEDSKPYEGVL